MYNENIYQRFLNLQNMGLITNADAVGSAESPLSGAVIKIYFQVKANIIQVAKGRVFGGVATMVLVDVACDLLRGKTLASAGQLTVADIMEAVPGIPEAKTHDAALIQEAIASALLDYDKRQEREEKKKN